MIIETNKAPQAIGPYSQAVKAGEYVYISGCVPFSPEDGSIPFTDIEGQSELTLNNLKAIVEAAGAEMSQVVKTTCFISDLNNFVKFNGVYATYFEPGSFPARACVEVARLPKDVLIEVEAVVYLNK
ncbi:Rid family detoxifying hydrolase [Photobacterium profundum]|uniref:Translation initiation inhibitor, yjgF family n=1 Tax=Photobacterium profundum (strain SS9) TaxID=298386 RepID=Q6LMW7_PHOPR|nr:Rid family detoxifying hydrolase [Photobacterium profundum]CAG21359.1 putative translation initiation inhibitor, yjgF family [Photobacterium profundum SS9]